MNNWKIGPRITAGFTVVILIAAALGLFAYNRVGIIDKSAVQVVSIDVPKLYLVGQLERNVPIALNLAAQCIAASDRQDVEDFESQLKALRSSNSAVVGEYEKLESTERGHALTEELKGVRAGFWGSVDEMVKAKKTGSGAHRQGGEAILRTQVRPWGKKYADVTRNIVEYNKSLADAGGASIQASVAGARSGVHPGGWGGGASFKGRPDMHRRSDLPG